jgi:hypothetical protein
VVLLIDLFQKGVGNKKIEPSIISEKMFGEVPMTGQLSNQFIEGIRQIYELEPFIKVENSVYHEWGRVRCNA